MAVRTLLRLYEKRIPNSAEFQLLSCVANHVDDNLTCFVGDKFMAHWCGWSEDKLEDTLDRLTDKHWLSALNTPQGRGILRKLKLDLDAIPDRPKWERKVRQTTPFSDEQKVRNSGEEKSGNLVSSPEKKSGNLGTYIPIQEKTYPKEGDPLSSPDGSDMRESTPNDGSSFPDRRRRKEKTSAPTFVAMQLADLLANLRLGNDPDALITPETRKRWAHEVDKMIRLDHRTPDQIQARIEWTQNDSFWKAVVLSMGKVRQKFDDITMRMQQPKGGSRGGRQDHTDETIAGLQQALMA